MTSRKDLARGLPLMLWTLLVGVLLVMPGDEIPDLDLWNGLDKPAHAVLFAVHYGLLVYALAGSRTGGGLLVTALASGLYALLLEIVQLWVPGRGFDGGDLVADAAGIGATALLLGRWRASISPAP